MTDQTISRSEHSSPWVGIGWMLLTGGLFVCVIGIVRYVGSDIPAPQAAFIRYFIGLGLMLPFLKRIFEGKLNWRTVALYGLRGFANALGVVLWFYAMANIPIAEVTAIGYTVPIFVTLGAVIFFGEAMATRQILALVVAFIGVLFILRPGFQDINHGQLAQLLAAPAFAVSYLVAKQLSATENAITIVWMLTIFVTIFLAPFAWAVWVTPSLSDVFWLGLVAVFATLGHVTMTKALGAAPLIVTQPVTFLQLVWATLLGSLAFGEAMNIWVLLGGGLIVAAVSFISYREWVVSR
jgi:drug/metabolite transporter (DMT)-like permease